MSWTIVLISQSRKKTSAEMKANRDWWDTKTIRKQENQQVPD